MPATDSRGRARRQPPRVVETPPEPPRRRRSRRRSRRAAIDRPLNGALVRAASLLLVVPLVLLMITIGRPGPYPASALPPAFEVAAATSLAAELALDYPNREPGSAAALGAVDWVKAKLAQYGLEAGEDTWEESIPGVGRVQLHNLVVVVPGSSPDAIVVLAHRDNVGVGPGANDNASGTAALIELARGYGRLGTVAGRPKPMHTLVFLSTDGGAYGGYGAARFAATSPLRGALRAVVSLDGLATRARPRLEIAGTVPHSPTPALIRTVDVRVTQQLGESPARPGWLAQLVALGIPFGFGEQAPFLARAISAIRLSTAPDQGGSPETDTPGRLDRATFGRLGQATAAIVASLDSGIELAGGTSPGLYLGSRVVRGWALELLFLTALVPFLAGTIDLLARCRRRRIHLAGAWRALRVRLWVWLWIGLLIWVGALAGVFPRNLPVTPPGDSPAVSGWPLGGLAAIVALALAGWWRARRGLVPARPASETEIVAGHAISLTALAGIAVATALVSPFGLVFVLPSLYSWLWIAQVRRTWARDALFGLGFAGPALAVVAIGTQLALGLDAPLYLVSLATLGFVPWTTVLIVLAWAAVATQLGAIVAGRYRSVPPRHEQSVQTD